MTSKSIDREAPVQGAVVIHPLRDGKTASRSPEARLEEAVGLAAVKKRENVRMLQPCSGADLGEKALATQRGAESCTPILKASANVLVASEATSPEEISSPGLNIL